MLIEQQPRRRFVLRDLPYSARLTLACFLIAVGLGYVSAMVQLHLQHTTGAGNLLPTNDDVMRVFHGTAGPPKSKLEMLLEADEALPFSGTGSMSAAFTKRSEGWTKVIRERPEADVRKEREGERQAMLAWAKAGAPQDAFDADKYPLPAGATTITADYRDGDSVKIKQLFTDRCDRCHSKDGADDKATKFPLETYEQIRKYTTPEVGGGRMSLEALTQSTHAHLLSFAVLFMLTGLCFALTNYPGPLRLVISPLVLIAQVLEIACWWLARLDGTPGEQFALAIPVLGMIVGGGLGVQIVLTLFHLFGTFGKLLILAAFCVAGFLGFITKEKVIEPYLKDKWEQIKK